MSILIRLFGGYILHDYLTTSADIPVRFLSLKKLLNYKKQEYSLVVQRNEWAFLCKYVDVIPGKIFRRNLKPFGA